jgi:hypothetical protein
MDYVIKNNRNCYIRLDDNGTAISCSEAKRDLFNETKARNILKGLPKGLRNMGFRVEAIPDIQPKKMDDEERKENFRVLQGGKRTTSENISRWIEMFGQCDDVLKNASERYRYLEEELHNKDLELMDILHTIEMSGSFDLFRGWKLYKDIKQNRESRRDIKDEILIINNVLREMKFNWFSRERTEKAIQGLFDRKYTFRIVEEDDQNDSM